MKVLHDCSDERLQKTCVYCGDPPETQDHVPSKFLLDDPFPDNLPKVSACRNCNNGFSLDEEYFGCFIEVVLRGSADPALEMRPKVQNALTHNPRLAAMIESKRVSNENGIWWEPNLERIERVVYKLAQGHAAYEYSAPVLDKPEILIFQPLLLMSDQQRSGFETPQASILWPEVGSRAMQRLIYDWPQSTQTWNIVQPNRYRFHVTLDGQITVRIVLSEYLACIVCW